jgi:hypothetical protein
MFIDTIYCRDGIQHGFNSGRTENREPEVVRLLWLN